VREEGEEIKYKNEQSWSLSTLHKNRLSSFILQSITRTRSSSSFRLLLLLDFSRVFLFVFSPSPRPKRIQRIKHFFFPSSLPCATQHTISMRIFISNSSFLFIFICLSLFHFICCGFLAMILDAFCCLFAHEMMMMMMKKKKHI
jgi:hypothetical protein